MKTNKMLAVKWDCVEAEMVPIFSTTGLKVCAVDRSVQFVRNNPNAARYSAANDPRRGKPVQVL